MLMATIILNKYQQHLFNFSSLVFNNSLQSTLESFACGTQLFLGYQVLFSSQVRLSILVQIVISHSLLWRHIVADGRCLFKQPQSVIYHWNQYDEEISKKCRSVRL